MAIQRRQSLEPGRHQRGADANIKHHQFEHRGWGDLLGRHHQHLRHAGQHLDGLDRPDAADGFDAAESGRGRGRQRELFRHRRRDRALRLPVVSRHDLVERGDQSGVQHPQRATDQPGPVHCGGDQHRRPGHQLAWDVDRAGLLHQRASCAIVVSGRNDDSVRGEDV